MSPVFKPLAYALILLRPDGYPYVSPYPLHLTSVNLPNHPGSIGSSCVFWGDLYGTSGPNPQQPVSQLSDLIRARKLFAYGEMREYRDHANCVGWVRVGNEEHEGCAVVVCNGEEG